MKIADQLNIIKDNELVIRLQQDDVDAFDGLYRQYHEALYFNIFKLVKEAGVTEDILQDVFITLWEKRMSLDPAQSISGWLFVVSYNNCMRQLRQTAKRCASVHPTQIPALVSLQPEADQTELQWKIMEEAIEHLSPQKRKVFELCKLQGKSYEQTAAELAISKHTVKEYLSGATSYIRSYVRQHAEYQSLGLCLAWLTLFLND